MKFKRVFLINPAYGKGQYGAVLCAGLGYIAEFLKKAGIEYDVVDMSLDYSLEEVKERIRKFKPDLIGVSAISINYQHVYDIIKELKRSFPKAKIVMGGPHVSTYRKDILKECKEADYAIVLEGDENIIELCRGKELSKIKGLIYRKNGKIVYTGDRPFIKNWDELPFPTYEKFELDKYPEKSIPIVTSRGCPYQCIYCPVKTTIGQEFRVRSAKNVVDEIEYWHKRGYVRFGITDDNFTLREKRVYDICDEIEKRGLKDLQLVLGNGIRADRVDKKLLKRMKEVGFRELAFGIESANEDILKVIKKGETLSKMERAVKDACDLGFEVGLFFILGSPTETVKQIENSFKFAKKYPVAYAYFYNLIPFPQTELYEYAKDNELLLSPPSTYLNMASHWNENPCFETPELSKEDRIKAYRRGKQITREIKYRHLSRKFGKYGVIGKFLAYIVTRERVNHFIMTNRFIKKYLQGYTSALKNMKKIKVDFISGIKTEKVYGFKRYQDEIHSRLKNVRLNNIVYSPSKYGIVHMLQLLFKYPYIIQKSIKKGNIKHIATPNLAYILSLFKFKKCIITCYDLVSQRRYKDFGLLAKFLIKLNMRGLKRASFIITISDFSKREIHEYLGIPLGKIEVAKPAVNHEIYYKKRSKAILKKYRLDSKDKIIMYVGSEEPRQNVDKILMALNNLKTKLPNVKFLKVGRPQWKGGREHLLKMIEKFGLEKTVIFTDYVPEKDLPKLYNAVDLVVYPCAYTGWGLPPLEGMACGTPAVTSNTSALPEVVGDVGIMVDPDNIKQLSEEMYRVLTNKKLWNDLSNRGVKWAKGFSWALSSKKVLKVYENLLEKK